MKKRDTVTCLLFCGFLVGAMLLFLLLPKAAFSEKEKRYLTEAPAFSWEALASGAFGADLEAYLADHVPGRDGFVGLCAYFDLLTGRQIDAPVYAARGGRLLEPPAAWNPDAAARNMDAISKFASAVGQRVDVLLIPSAGAALEDTICGLHDSYDDEAMIRDIYAMAGDNVSCLDVTDTFLQSPRREELYYRTDHHWTSLGAYRGYRAYQQLRGRTWLPEEAFSVETVPGFRGSTYSRSGLWLTKPENLELWQAEGDFTVTNAETEGTHDGLFYRERLEELDKYTVFLDGNHSLVRIRHPQGQGNLLVIRDSFSNCLGTFLANSYETVTLVDLRYYKKPVSELFAEEAFTDVLVCYSIGNFLTDPNLIWLR